MQHQAEKNNSTKHTHTELNYITSVTLTHMHTEHTTTTESIHK